jgi:hypothetical protein
LMMIMVKNEVEPVDVGNKAWGNWRMVRRWTSNECLSSCSASSFSSFLSLNFFLPFFSSFF